MMTTSLMCRCLRPWKRSPEVVKAVKKAPLKRISEKLDEQIVVAPPVVLQRQAPLRLRLLAKMVEVPPMPFIDGLL